MFSNQHLLFSLFYLLNGSSTLSTFFSFHKLVFLHSFHAKLLRQICAFSCFSCSHFKIMKCKIITVQKLASRKKLKWQNNDLRFGEFISRWLVISFRIILNFYKMDFLSWKQFFTYTSSDALTDARFFHSIVARILKKLKCFIRTDFFFVNCAARSVSSEKNYCWLY